MSYDLMVFEPDAVPARHSEFLDWCAQQTKWSQDHGYNDPSLSSHRLRGWLDDIVQIFPPMNADEESSTDYAIGSNFIYVSFAWSRAEAAYMTVSRLAEKHNLGLFNASSSGEEVWVPKNGMMKLAHDKSPPTLVGRIMGLLNLTK